MHFTRTDSLKLFFYTTLFVLLFFGYNKASGPYYETTYDSASIRNREMPVAEVVPEKAPEIPKQAIVRKNIQRKKVEKNPLTITFNPDYVKIDNEIVERLKEVIYSPHFHSKVTPLSLVLDSEREEPRGQVTGNKLILSTSLSDDSEQLKVFVHELGHIVDIFYLKKGLFADPSDRFYAISWESFNTKKRGQKITNFVSGYALSNKYEDFAESFSFYIFHNENFAGMAKKDPIIRAKYDFFTSYIFGKDAFVGTSFWMDILKTYNWDTTKIPIDAKKYLYYIK